MKLLLACDLDRTVIPDGPDPISPGVMDMFSDFVKTPGVTLAYVTGRSLPSFIKVMNEYSIPSPEIFIGDLGTSIYKKNNSDYDLDPAWTENIKNDWQGIDPGQIRSALSDISYLKPQEEMNQGKYKVSYYTDENVNQSGVQSEIQAKLKGLNIKSLILITPNLIDHFSYLDILPASAAKECSLKYLIESAGYQFDDVVYAGDSHNDLQPLAVGYKSIIVKNADQQFVSEVTRLAESRGFSDQLYVARGGFRDLNGNYVAGILEGLNHFGYILN